MTKDEVIAFVRSATSDFGGIVSIYLFGSFAEERQHRESDIDVGILVDRTHYPREDDRFDLRLRLSAALSRYRGPQADVVMLNDAPATLGRAIITRGERIFCTDEQKDHDFVRDVQLQAPDLEMFLQRMRAIRLDALGRR